MFWFLYRTNWDNFRTSGCGGTITQNSTHIQNTGYPTGYTDTQSCTYTFKKSSLDVCAIRLDYVEFVTRGPDVNTSPYTRCDDDYMTFTTPSSNAPPTLCGYLTGQHIYLDADRTSLTSNPTMTLTFEGALSKQSFCFSTYVLLNFRVNIFSNLENPSWSDCLWPILHTSTRMYAVSHGECGKL